MTKISGYLKDGAGQAVAQCAIILFALKTSNQVIEQIESCTTTKDGFYEINALTGQYQVTLTIAGHPPKKIGVITVYNDSPNGTLNDFLANGIANDDITPLLLSQLIEERKQAQQAAQSAQTSATDASSTLANVLKKTGDEMSGPLSINTNNNSYFDLIENSNKSMRLFINNDNGGIGFSGSDSIFPKTRLRFIQSNNKWNFENSSVVVNNIPVLKQGDYGLGLKNTSTFYPNSIEDLLIKETGSILFVNAKKLPTDTFPGSVNGVDSWWYFKVLGKRDGNFSYDGRYYLSKNGFTDSFIGLSFDGPGSGNYFRWQKIITSSNISQNNILQKGDYAVGGRAIHLSNSNVNINNLVTTQTSWYNAGTAGDRPTTAGWIISSNIIDGQAMQIAFGYQNTGIFYRDSTDSTWRKWQELITTANTTVDSNGFYKKASPICRLFANDNINEVDSFKLAGCGLVNSEADGVSAKRIAVGHYEIHDSLGFAQSSWYIETPQDANGNKKLFVEYETDQNNMITVKTYQNCFENGRFVAGEPMDIPDGRWIDLRLLMPETLAE